MNIIKITEPSLKSETCESILRSLPQWFGIESAIIKYIKDVQAMETWAVYENGFAIGFVSINKHFPKSAEVHVMGILEKFHRKGIGHKLLDTLQNDLLKEGVEFLSVKTLSESRSSKEYDQTRKFYEKVGFVPLEEFKTLWDEHNPCLFLVKALR